MEATTSPDDDLNRSTQILLRHGFVVKGLSPPADNALRAPPPPPAPPRPNDSKSPSLSPVGPTHSDFGLIAGDPNGGMVRVHSDGAIPSRRVTWDLSCAGTGFPALPFMKGEQEHESVSSSQRARSTTKKFQRRSTIAAIAMAERIVLQQEMREQQQLRQQYCSSQPEHDDIKQDSRKPSSSREQRRRSSATTFGMSEQLDKLLQQQQQNESEAEHMVENIDHQRYHGYREDYFLGDVVKSSSHMIIESAPKRAIRAVESLQIHDFAWVKRSDGLYTYAILAYRSTSPLTESPSTKEDEEYMYFVVDDIGSTKMVPKSRWHVNVRLVRENQ